jgi:hypothetical protein
MYPKILFEFILVWTQFKFGLKLFKSLNFELKTLESIQKSIPFSPKSSVLSSAHNPLSAQQQFSPFYLFPWFYSCTGMFSFRPSNQFWSSRPRPAHWHFGPPQPYRHPPQAEAATATPGATAPCAVVGRPPVLGGRGSEAPLVPPPFPSSSCT